MMHDLATLREIGRAAPVIRHEGRIQREPVTMSRELERILAIPRHRGYSDEDRRAMQRAVRRPGGTMKLYPAQADALLHALEAEGLFAPLAVGRGKTLISALVPTILERRRAIVLTTAALVEQTKALFEEYAEHFYIQIPMIQSYSKLSHPNYSELLKRIQPDLIVADEAHSLRERKSARTRRFLRLFKQFPKTMLVALSGTMCKRSLKDYAHLLYLSLKHWCPVPRDYPTLSEWAEALDPDAVRPPGALRRLCRKGEKIQEGYARRLKETRGVVASPADALGCSLRITIKQTPHSEAIEAVRKELHSTWERSDGEELTTALEVAAVDHQLRLGGHYVWAEEPDRLWLQARKLYRRAVRKWIQDHPRSGIDSPALLERAVRNERVKFSPYAEWCEMKDTADEPPKKWKWIDDAPIRWAAREEKKHGPLIIFSDTVAPGKRCAKLAKIPYYGRGAADAAAIVKETGKRSFVASFAHIQGRNLQMYSRAIVLGAPPTGTVWEQMLGREHRNGQLADEVEYVVPTSFLSELERAIEDAKYIQTSMQQPQKLCIATIVRQKRTTHA